ncbi:hypothetical protein [Actinomadura sp. 21ATH]|uniref:hypothetical protein n=1 Tax=Actinomadura sp. 21ATH TaxID=1735444 RepID=UPI0035C23A1E
MRKSIRKGLVASAVVAAGIGLTATPAMADAPWAITGANADGSAAAESTNTSLRVVRNNAVLTCEVVAAEANIENVTGHNGNAIAQITGSEWTSCTGPLNLSFNVVQNGTWNLNADQTTSDPNVNNGSITNVSATISGPGCTATFTGGVNGHYTNGDGILTLDPSDPDPRNTTLTASNVTGCLGIIVNGDTGEFSGDFFVDPAVTLTGTP